jgi:hypothetical protein
VRRVSSIAYRTCSIALLPWLQVLPPIAAVPCAPGGCTYAVGDDVGVALQAPLGVTVRGLVAGEVPDDQGLVAGTGQEHVRAGRCQYKSCRMQPRTVSVFRGVQNSKRTSRGR